MYNLYNYTTIIYHLNETSTDHTAVCMAVPICATAATEPQSCITRSKYFLT